TIRYIGRDVKGEQVYGIELDEKVPKGTDGKHNQMRYFTCRPGRGIFVRKHVIKGAVDEDYMPKYDVGDRVKLSRGRCGHIKYIEDTDEGEIFGIEIETEAGRTRLKIDKMEQSEKPLSLGETVELKTGLIGTVRFIGPTHFAKNEDWIGVELHDGWGQHDGAFHGARYFTCPANRGVFVKEVKRRRKDDPSTQYLQRRCPECEGEFLKLRNPQAAYRGIGMVCDHCNRRGNQFSKDDWFFQCSKCEQIDLCLECMLKLRPLDENAEEDVPDIRAKYRQIGGLWVFEEIDVDDAISELSHKDQDPDNNAQQNVTQDEEKYWKQTENAAQSTKFYSSEVLICVILTFHFYLFL
ncbi:CAP-Gly domain-containing linker protein 3, partial [Reticulomyxa filosa]